MQNAKIPFLKDPPVDFSQKSSHIVQVKLQQASASWPNTRYSKSDMWIKQSLSVYSRDFSQTVVLRSRLAVLSGD